MKADGQEQVLRSTLGQKAFRQLDGGLGDLDKKVARGTYGGWAIWQPRVMLNLHAYRFARYYVPLRTRRRVGSVHVSTARSVFHRAELQYEVSGSYHQHPDDEALARAVQATPSAELVFNYRGAGYERWVEVARRPESKFTGLGGVGNAGASIRLLPDSWRAGAILGKLLTWW